MRKVARRGNRRLSATGLLFSVIMFISLFPALLIPSAAQAQPTYTYAAFHTELNVNADGSLLVRNKVTYEFGDPAGWVGLFVPASYGKVVEGRVLGADGAALPDDSWDQDQSPDGYTLWCDSSGAGANATYVFEYLLYGGLEAADDRVGVKEWSAVPEERASPILESSLTLRFPAGLDTSLVDLEVYSTDYSGQITKRFVGNDTAVVEAGFLDASSSYSVSCYWPASLMNLAGVGFDPQAGKGWDFERFDVDIRLNEDSSYTVRETQIVNFRGSFSWLNRDLSTEPANAYDGRTYGRVRIHDIKVFGLDGEPYDQALWGVESLATGKRVRIDFEARDESRGWIIEYRMTGALIFDDEYDRLYWDAVSKDREVPIRSSNITVHLPPGTDMAAVDASQYLDIGNPPSIFESGRDGETLWWRVEDIPAGTTFTIDVALPKGTVAKPWQYDMVCGIAVIASSAIIFAGALLFMILLWWKKGRDAGRTGTTMVRYGPPDGLTPAMVGMLVNEKPRVQDISATIVDLARRGYLTIIEEEQRKFIRIKKFAFQRLTHDMSGLLPYERRIMEGLFSKGDRVSESDLQNRFYTHIDAILKHGVSDEVMSRGLFTREPGPLRRLYVSAGILIAAIPPVAGLILTMWYDLGWFAILILSSIPIGIVVLLVGWAMPSRSQAGSRAYEHAMGFKDFMQTAEKAELEYMTPENFQDNLPYAMVLGVSGAWAQKFKDIYTSPPQWYSGSSAAFSSVYLASSLGEMTGRLNSTLTSSPSSSGSGGGGGFGGGSSGGGFGGGGSSAG
jgi:uncharacterized membrane protein YgcG